MTEVQGLDTFTIAAANLPEHARNPIHTDAGAQAAGFPRALVAGVTTYAYLSHPAAAGWGLPWLESGWAHVRFRRPVFDGDIVDCVPTGRDGEVTIEARVGDDDRPRAVAEVGHDAGPAQPMRTGEELPDRTVRLDGELGVDYGWRAGDRFGLYREHGIVHPAVWPAIANHVVHTHVARGPWVHTRSLVRHHSLVAAGVEATVRAVVVERFQAHGERAVLDVLIEVDGITVATIEHEAIVALPA